MNSIFIIRAFSADRKHESVSSFVGTKSKATAEAAKNLRSEFGVPAQVQVFTLILGERKALVGDSIRNKVLVRS